MNNLLSIILLSTLTLLQISATEIEPPPQLYHPVYLEHPHAINRRQADQPIRITPVYDTDSMSFLTAQQRTYIQNIIMTNITSFFSRLLSVKPLGVPIRSARGCNGRATTVQFNNFQSFAPGCFGTCSASTTCGAAVIPEDHLFRCLECNSNTGNCEYSSNSTEGAGITDTDLILYVTATNTNLCPGLFAYATPCTLEYALNRPVVGSANFCPQSFTQGVTDEFLITVIKHEIMHVLGFNSFLYAFFRDENGNPRTPRTDLFGSVPTNGNGFPIPSNTTSKFVNYTWETANGVGSQPASLLTTPKVVEEAREHFGCDAMEGAELESAGGQASAGNHWDLRVFGNELMIPIILTADQPLSRITLALLEDSGWYKANYDLAENFLGNNLGCDFVNRSCLGYYNRDNVKEENAFCFQENEQGCTATRDLIGTCWIFDYPSQLPNLYQYFSDPNKGGPFGFSEYCPFYRGLHDCTNSNQQSIIPLFSNGPNSRCFNHMGNVSVSVGITTTTQPINAGCYQYSCNGTGVYVTVGSRQYECKERGDVVRVEETVGGATYTVSLICPSCQTICWDRVELCVNRTQEQEIETTSMTVQTNTSTQTRSNTPMQTETNAPTTVSKDGDTMPTGSIGNSGTVVKLCSVLMTILLLVLVTIVS